jgi:hypothetical protein
MSLFHRFWDVLYGVEAAPLQINLGRMLSRVGNPTASERSDHQGRSGRVLSHGKEKDKLSIGHTV